MTAEARDRARELVDDPTYQANLKERLKTGLIAPGVEAMLWHYAHGKPPDTLALTDPDGKPAAFTLRLDTREDK